MVLWKVEGTPVSPAPEPSSSVDGAVPDAITNGHLSEPGIFLGCYEDHSKKRDFDVEKGRCDSMTPRQCAALCRGFEYYALQRHDECRCGTKAWKSRYKRKALLCMTPFSFDAIRFDVRLSATDRLVATATQHAEEISTSCVAATG